MPQGPGSRWREVRLVTLEEVPGRGLEMDEEGWVDFEVGAKQILTIEFLP